MSLPSELGQRFELGAIIVAGDRGTSRQILALPDECVLEHRLCPEPIFFIRSKGTAIVLPQLICKGGDFAFSGPVVAALFTGSLTLLLSRIMTAAELGMVHLLPKHCGCTTQRQLKDEPHASYIHRGEVINGRTVFLRATNERPER